MDIIALAGGYGTRLGALTFNTPKALLPLNDIPLLTYTLARLNKLEDIGTIYIVSNDKFHRQLTDWARSAHSRYPIKVLNDGTTANENRLGSVGDLDFAIRTQRITKDVLLIGTDNFFTADLNHVILRAKETKSSTVGFYDVKDITQAKQFGIGTLDTQGRLIDFVEKPANPPSTLSLMMLWCILAKDFPLISQCVAQKKADRAGDFIKMLSATTDVYGVVYDKPFYDIGSLETYQQLNTLLKEQKLL